MAGVNKVILVGNLGKDPEVRHLEGGSKVIKFTLATSETFKDKSGNRKETTEWHNITIWRENLMDIAEKYLKKGMTIYLEGRIRNRSYEKEGVKHYTSEIVADSFTFLSKKENSTSEAPSTEEGSADISSTGTDGLPF